MTRAKFFEILKSVHAAPSESWMAIPIHETPLDSLDLMMLRSALEASLKQGISDNLWFESQTLNELLIGLT